MLDCLALSQASASFPLTLFLGFLIALVALGIDSTAPGLPALAEAFGSDPAAAQLTLTGLFAGVALGQLFWGPLSDRHGRRFGLLAGLAIVAAASVASALASDPASLATLRFVQGFALSCGPVIGRSIVRDRYSHERAAQLLARMMVVFGLVPIAAPVIGSLLLVLSGWQAVYWLHALAAAALLAAAARLLPPGAPGAASPQSAPALAATFAALLRQRPFLVPFLVLLGVQLGVIAFVSHSSVPLISGFGLSPTEYGLAFAGVMFGQIGGAMVGSRLVPRLGLERMLRLGAVLAMAAGALLATLAWIDLRHWFAVVAPMFVYMIASSFVIPNATAAALSPFPQAAGSASSLLGAVAFGAGAVLSTVLGWTADGSARALASAIALCAAGAWAALRFLPRQPVRSRG